MKHSKYPTPSRILAALALATLFWASPFVGRGWATPMNFSYLHGGFGEGAYVFGMFKGEDLNGDGLITSQNLKREVTFIRLEFSGNSLIPAFTVTWDSFWQRGDIIYDLNGFLGDGHQEGLDAPSPGGFYRYTVGPQPWPMQNSCGIGIPCAAVYKNDDFSIRSTSAEMAQITGKPSPVPEPTSLLYLGSGLVGLAGRQWRKTRTKPNLTKKGLTIDR